MPTKKAAKRKPAKTSKRASKKSSKAPKRKKPKAGPGHHLERAHHHTMKALPNVTRADVDALKKIARAVEHAEENARSAKVG